MTDLENKNPNENGINSQDSTTNNDISKSLNGENFSQTLNQQPEIDANQSISENKSEVNPVLNGATQNESSTQNSSEMGGNSNEIFLGKFENEMINTIDKKDTDNTNSADYPNPINYQINTGESEESQVDNQEAEKAKLAQKEKLIHLIKSHESKANKKGLINGILIGVLCSIIVLVLGILFAKDQIVNLLNSGNNYSQNDCISDINPIVNTVESNESTAETDETTTDETTTDETTTDETITNETTTDETITNETTTDETITDETTTDEITTDEITTDETTTDETTTDETITDETTTDEATTDETTTDETTTDEITTDESTTDETTTDKTTTDSEEASTEETNVSITHVNTPEEANWVLPAHCSDLTCYGEDKEFSPCTTFKLVENLDENAHRIGNNGSCRYKDNSELVYVKL